MHTEITRKYFNNMIIEYYIGGRFYEVRESERSINGKKYASEEDFVHAVKNLDVELERHNKFKDRCYAAIMWIFVFGFLIALLSKII